MIKAGLESGTPVDKLEAQVKKAFPKYAFVNGTHPFSRAVSYYRRQLKAKK